MSNNFHSAEFDDATLLKLEIYRNYISEWLPVFIKRSEGGAWNGKINVFDFFCGPGIDKCGNKGSPLIAIEECKKFSKQLEDSNRVVSFYFSDDKSFKIKQLNKELSGLELPDSITYETSSEKFTHAFMRKMRNISGAANLLFIDQCGIKEVTPPIFNTLTGLKRTDFLFFIASSYFARFKESEEFKRYIDASDHLVDDTPYYDTHRVIAAMYRDLIPADTEYYLAPFTLKKGANLYGLIFGTSNLLGILKFLKICWKIDSERGEANFDIDNDNLPSKPGDMDDFFKDNSRARKVTVFQNKLEEKLLQGCFYSDKEVFVYTLECGFIPTSHAKGVVVKLIKNQKLFCEGVPRLSKVCIKEPRQIKLN